MSQELEASIIKALRRDGFKATPQQIAIGRLVLSDHSHPRAQEVYEKVKAMHPTVSPRPRFTGPFKSSRMWA